MKHSARIARLQRLLLTRELLPPFVIHIEHDDRTIEVRETYMVFA